MLSKHDHPLTAHQSSKHGPKVEAPLIAGCPACEESMRAIPDLRARIKALAETEPFKELRVSCNPDSFDHQYNTCDCSPRGWVPEPDPERACWRLIKLLSRYDRSYWGSFNEETVISAAEAWVKEQVR